MERVGGELDFRPEEDGSFQLVRNQNQKRIAFYGNYPTKTVFQ